MDPRQPMSQRADDDVDSASHTGVMVLDEGPVNGTMTELSRRVWNDKKGRNVQIRWLRPRISGKEH